METDLSYDVHKEFSYIYSLHYIHLFVCVVSALITALYYLNYFLL